MDTDKPGHIRPYARFVLEHRLEEAALKNLTLARQLPLLRLFAHLPEEELTALVKEGMRRFLEQLAAGQALEGARESFAKWRADELDGVSKGSVVGTDIILVYSARRQTLVSLLRGYTQDPLLFSSIVLEMEQVFVGIEQEALQTYGDIQEQLHAEANEKLRLSRKKLQEVPRFSDSQTETLFKLLLQPQNVTAK